ncbi:SUPPRESSOR OF GAMMA RESPONSE 1-like [Gossypium arboreum]|uniref:SUPPRESSOR OF GAMMA RESPONSE 1-like n=1 Tax=Gossypium arboreum TaxID=29729 RepID=UPI0022F1847D|nr:SUPPRESSOR OF GAMMA RESPONSE 1-like [Gossypium arboreum]
MFMASRSWFIDSRSIAKKVKNAIQITDTDCGAIRECPNCHHRIDNSDVSPQWPGLPIGVKFDPSDIELLEHLAAKCGIGDLKPHPFIDEFIPTLNEDQGICYTHPQNLPGVKKDGSSIHFFHQTINAYAIGQRKRRRIQNRHSTIEEHVRWHKTGKTKPVIENGVRKGWKKIMVLYKRSNRTHKPEKSNWVMHQYHLGAEEVEVGGKYVVSKISYQQRKQTDKNDGVTRMEDSDNSIIRASPRTPKTMTPSPPRPWKSIIYEGDIDEKVHQESKFAAEGSNLPIHGVECEDHLEYPLWLAGESQAAVNSEMNCLDNSSLQVKNSVKDRVSYAVHDPGTMEMSAGNKDACTCGISELENLEFDTPPDVSLSDLQFDSQESISSWLDQL